MKKSAIAAAWVGASVFGLSAFDVSAQAYPNRSVRIVLPWPAGGITDVITRAINLHLSEVFGQQFVIDNRPGAGGTLGVALGAKSPPDGYTLIMTDVMSHCISATLYGNKLPYDPLKDVTPIAMVAGSPMVLIANPAPGVRSVPQMIQLAKSRPGQLNYASSGTGSITHLAAVRMQKMAGINLLHVPFKGSIPAASSVIGGETFMSFSTIPAALPHSKTGKLVLLATSFPKRSPQIPEVPAIAEFLSPFDLGLYSGLWAPAGTPKEIVDRLHTEVMKALETAKGKEVLAATSAIPGRFMPAEFSSYLAKETKDWGEIVRTSGVKID